MHKIVFEASKKFQINDWVSKFNLRLKVLGIMPGCLFGYSKPVKFYEYPKVYCVSKQK